MLSVVNQNRKPERLKKKPIRLTLSQQARDHIEKELLQDGSLASSISDLLEKIGLGEISVSRSAGDSQIALLRFPIYKRLVFLMQEPPAVIISTLAFVLRMSRQLGLDSSMEAILQVVRQGICVAFAAGYTFPDRFINNPSALLRWTTFCILSRKFLTSVKSKTGSEETESRDKSSHRCLYKMNAAIKGIRSASRSHKLEAFKMKAIDGFTISQIIVLFQVQDKDFTEEQAYRRIKDGWGIFRQHWVRQEPDENSELFEGRDVDEIKSYCELVQLDKLSDQKQLEEIENLLFRTSNDSFLDLLINEVDYNWYRSEPENLAILEKLRENIAKNLSSWLLDKKKEIDEKLIFCGNSEDLARMLEQIVKDEMDGQAVPVKALLSSNYYAFQQVNHAIEEVVELEDCSDIKQKLRKLSGNIEKYAESHSWLFESKLQAQ